jgi:hypothetical protein
VKKQGRAGKNSWGKKIFFSLFTCKKKEKKKVKKLLNEEYRN